MHAGRSEGFARAMGGHLRVWQRLAVGILTPIAVCAATGVLGQQPKSDRSIRFGDVVLRDFETADLELGVRAQASGPKTTIDAVDADRSATAQVKARQITATMVKEKAPRAAARVGRVERIEAVGNVQFSGTRKADDGKGTVSVRASGSKAVYDRTALVLTLSGPVKFSAEQPDAGGAGMDTVTGSAERAVYDEGKKVLQLFGKVQATVVTPDTPPEGSSFSGDEVKIDMSVLPYKVFIANPSLSGSINIKVREPEPAAKPNADER